MIFSVVPDRSMSWRGLGARRASSCALLIALALYLPAFSQAQSPFPNLLGRTPATQPRGDAVSTTPHPAIARIIVPEKDGVSYGSGSLVDARGEYGLIVTNWHVVRDASGVISVLFPDGFSTKAEVVKTDKDWDLAALSIRRPTAAPLPMTATPPQPGERLTIAGYGSGDFRAAAGKCTQYLAPGDSFPYELVEISVEARQGDSGGPILNERGEIAGVLFGSNRSITTGSYGGRVMQFLTSVIPGGVPGSEPGSSTPPVLAQGTPPVPGSTAEPNQFSAQSPLGVTEPDISRQLAAMSLHPSAGPSSRESATVDSQNSSNEERTAPGPTTDEGLMAVPRKSAGLQPLAGASRPPADESDLADSAPRVASAAAPRAISLAPREGSVKSSSGSFTAQTGALTPRKGNTGETKGNLQETPADQLLVAAWRKIGGTTLWDQAKTVLAMIGLLALFVQFWRMNSAPEPQVEED